jgi:glycolate oxidase subunit GlcD
MCASLGDALLSRGDFARIVGASHVLAPEEDDGAAHFGHDATVVRGLSGRPGLVVRPCCASEVAAVLALCWERSIPLVPRGGGTGLAGGAVPLGGEVVCSLARLRGIREFEPSLWRIFPEAGVRTRDVQRLARENGLLFPPDPGASGESLIGGNVATNAGGPHAFKYGPVGAFVTGLEAVVAPGEVIALGGAGRRDVAGYDLQSLLVGSEGTLGIITAVRLRLLPAPAAASALLSFFPSRAAGCAAVLAVLAAGVVPSALDFLDGPSLRFAAAGCPEGPPPAEAEFALLAEVDGTAAEVSSSLAELTAATAAHSIEMRSPSVKELWAWRDTVPGAVASVRGGKLSEDVSVPVERLSEALSGLDEIAARSGLPHCAWGHGADSIVHANLLLDPSAAEERSAAAAAAEEIFALAVSLGGSISGEHGVGLLKGGRLALQWPEAALRLHEEVKRAFDPRGLLNPGKKLAR